MNKIKFLLSMCLLSFLIVSFMSFHAPTVKGDESRLYYYSGLNGLDDTDVNYHGNVSSNLFHKQGNASLLVEVDGDAYINVANSSVVIPYVPPPPSPPYFNDLTCFGIYAYFSIESACPTIFISWLNASGGSQVGFREHLEDLDGTPTMVMSTFYTDAFVGNLYYDLGEYGYTLESLAGAWHWYEIDVWSLDPPLFDFYIDGSGVNMLWGGGINPSDPHTWGMSVAFAMSSYLESSTGNLFYDYFRFYEGEEFPPWLIGTAYNIQVTSTPIDASVKWDWDEVLIYTLPHNFSASAGLNHALSATVEVNANVSTRYLFQGWSIDGSPNVNTSNPLIFFPIADMTFQAIYSPKEIPDWSRVWMNFGIGLIGLIMMFLSWFVGYWIHKDGDTMKGILIAFVMFLIGYALFTVLLGG